MESFIRIECENLDLIVTKHLCEGQAKFADLNYSAVPLPALPLPQMLPWSCNSTAKQRGCHWGGASLHGPPECSPRLAVCCTTGGLLPSFCQRKIKSGAAVFSMNSEQHLASWKATQQRGQPQNRVESSGLAAVWGN